MCSRGSVIPLFIKQLEQGRPLTLTEPRMTRFLMSLHESVELVEHAFLHAEPGDLFVKKAPASTVQTLAMAVSDVLGVTPDVRRIGMRHGEKMHEVLLSSAERATSEDQREYFRVPLDARSLDYSVFVEEGDEDAAEMADYDSQNTRRLDVAQTATLLRSLPEFQAVPAV